MRRPRFRAQTDDRRVTIWPCYGLIRITDVIVEARRDSGEWVKLGEFNIPGGRLSREQLAQLVWRWIPGACLDATQEIESTRAIVAETRELLQSMAMLFNQHAFTREAIDTARRMGENWLTFEGTLRPDADSPPPATTQ